MDFAVRIFRDNSSILLSKTKMDASLSIQESIHNGSIMIQF